MTGASLDHCNACTNPGCSGTSLLAGTINARVRAELKLSKLPGTVLFNER